MNNGLVASSGEQWKRMRFASILFLRSLIRLLKVLFFTMHSEQLNYLCNHRHALTPTFSSSKLKQMLSIVVQCADQMVQNLKKTATENDGKFNSKEWVRLSEGCQWLEVFCSAITCWSRDVQMKHDRLAVHIACHGELPYNVGWDFENILCQTCVDLSQNIITIRKTFCRFFVNRPFWAFCATQNVKMVCIGLT